MARRIIVVSGPVAGGKSHLARGLATRFGGVRLSTRELLMPGLAPGEEPARAALQRIGARFDEETDGRWVADRLSRRIYDAGERLVIIDAARIAGQVEGLRRAFGREVRHVHVSASREACAERYEKRRERAEVREPESYEEVVADPTEAQVDTLGPMADIAIDTDRVGADDVIIRVAAQLGLLDRDHAPTVDVVVGGSYGSEGKGNIAFHLAPEYDLLVRVGGPNAAHKVYLASGEIFTHFSLPSGTQAGQANLVIGPGAAVYPPELLSEIARCDVSAERLSIDPQVMIIEDADKQAEADLAARISSTASGTGAATVLERAQSALVGARQHDPEPDDGQYRHRITGYGRACDHQLLLRAEWPDHRKARPVCSWPVGDVPRYPDALPGVGRTQFPSVA